MYKLIMLIKKRPDLTREQFIDYYDNRHVPFMHSILPRGAAVHRRNFVIPAAVAPGSAGDGPAAAADADYDVISEVFYEDLETANNARRALEDRELFRLMREDEHKFLLPDSIRRFVVEVHETVYRPIAGKGI
jgi:hypothetical protein